MKKNVGGEVVGVSGCAAGFGAGPWQGSPGVWGGGGKSQ